MELWHFLGDWHPKLVQFPLVLLLAGLLFDACGLIFRSAKAHWAALLLTAAGTLGLLFAFICGIYAEIWAGRAGVPQHPIELHELMANIASWGFVLLFAWRILLAEPVQRGQPKLKWLRLYTGVGLAWYSLLALTAYLGGQLVFSYGAGVTGSAGTVLTLEDLNTLATRQTDENLRYSEWMHHVFGLMTLGLSASLLAQALFPKSVPRLKWIVPTFLLAGGIFLFFMADRDLYALTDWRQLRDREVQLHKSIAIIMGTIGAIGLWKLRKRTATNQTANAGENTNPKPEERGSNSKLVAIMALIGGALLFTHVHTVAPYANVAAGVYIAHVTLGLVALSIGATRILQDFMPRRVRPLAIAFALFMGIESILLISYNEGLPWYIGYGTYNRWGPVQDGSVTVAPFGNFRACLLIDQQTGNLFVAFRDRFTDDPVQLTLDAAPQLLIANGSSEIALPLELAHADGDSKPKISATDLSGSNFRTHAEFVKNMPYVSARLVLKMQGRQRVGYFDPWVTSTIAAVPPNELARYQCPMHEGIRSLDPGSCALCDMTLVPIRPPLPAGQLHDSKYDLNVTVEAPEGTDKMRTRMTLRLTDDAKKYVPLAIVHEQLIHAIIVSEDLSFFDHIHPVQLQGGVGADAYMLTYTFPHAGRYLLFADMTPAGDREQVFRTMLVMDDAGLHVTITSVASAALSPDPARGRIIPVIPAPKTPQDSSAVDLSAPATSNIHAELLTQPRSLQAGLHATLLFRLSDGIDKPIGDISPYLGAAGHCVTISDDGQTFIHSHPEQFRMTLAGDKYGPEIAFHAVFPSPGVYRIWAQFKRGDQLLVAPFTVKVGSPPVPASWLRFLLNE